MIYELRLSRDGSKVDICFDDGRNLLTTMRSLESAAIAIGDSYAELAARTGETIKAFEKFDLRSDYYEPE